MTVVLGVNSGFVTEAPVTDPTGGAESLLDGWAYAQKDTSHATAIKVTEIGIWVDEANVNDSTMYVALYEHNSGDDLPGDQVASSESNFARGTTAGWKLKTGLNIVIDPSTIYWVAAGSTNIAGSIYTNNETTGGRRSFSSDETLPDPWSSTFVNANIVSISAAWEAGAPEPPTTSINIGGSWKSIVAMKINIDNNWKNVASAKINIGDAWKAVDIS